MILSLFRKDPVRDQAIDAYEAIVGQSRAPAFFTDHGAPDTVEGRFEILALHVFLVLRRLKGAGPAADRFSQALFDVFFQNMDDSLREMGVGDLSVGKKIRRMAEAFYGRLGAYAAGLDAGAPAEGAPDPLASALARNVFAAEGAHAASLAAYARNAGAHLAAQPIDSLIAGRVGFPDPALAARSQ